jgi:hypothetical protein
MLGEDKTIRVPPAIKSISCKVIKITKSLRVHTTTYNKRISHLHNDFFV